MYSLKNLSYLIIFENKFISTFFGHKYREVTFQHHVKKCFFKNNRHCTLLLKPNNSISDKKGIHTISRTLYDNLFNGKLQNGLLRKTVCQKKSTKSNKTSISNPSLHVERLQEMKVQDTAVILHDQVRELSNSVNPEQGKSSPPGVSGVQYNKALDWRPLTTDVSQLPGHYAALSKSRLTGLVVATAAGGYMLCPAPLLYSSLLGSCVGTALISAAANATNQVLEAPYDAQMNRTSNRVLVRGLMSPLHAACFIGVCGVGGVALLWQACNPLTAALGLTNLVLYTAVYTPMKRTTIANTWMGAVVGAIPPLIGWCGCSGSLIGAEAWGAWLLASLLFAWQFPHFNALSWNLRPDYSKAGYRMMCVTDPGLCKATCVRYSLLMVGLGLAAPLLDVTTWTFAADSAPLNGYMLYLSYRFYRDGDSRSARNLFRFSLVHLPAVIILMILSKKVSRDAAADTSAVAAVPCLTTVVYNNVLHARASSAAVTQPSRDMEIKDSTQNCLTLHGSTEEMADKNQAQAKTSCTLSENILLEKSNKILVRK